MSWLSSTTAAVFFAFSVSPPVRLDRLEFRSYQDVPYRHRSISAKNSQQSGSVPLQSAVSTSLPPGSAIMEPIYRCKPVWSSSYLLIIISTYSLARPCSVDHQEARRAQTSGNSARPLAPTPFSSSPLQNILILSLVIFTLALTSVDILIKATCTAVGTARIFWELLTFIDADRFP